MNDPELLFQRCILFVLDQEGGYVNDPRDPGGETNFGISKRSYPDVDIRALTKPQAIEIYRKDYWLPSGAVAAPWPLCLAILDAAVLQGPRMARTWAADGPSLAEYCFRRLRALAQIKGSPWLRGWVNRIVRLWVEGSKA